MSSTVELLENHVFDKNGNKVDLKEYCDEKIVGLYFSAYHCFPCRLFTPVLSDFYENHSMSKNFEIIFISCDKDKESFTEYYKEMPWLTLDFNKKDLILKLRSKFEITGIPRFVLIDSSSDEIICKNARNSIMNNDFNGFPYTNI